ncbi:hypothetical protein OAO01_02595 [Oligoflexia bacterium]|nr:hypothetical protein [Oligoflexia bacterium]
MKWKKLGKIFDPTKHQLPNNCFEFAQSPQTLILKDFVRIYFSTRAKDVTGKFLSHISYIDVDKSFTNILSVSSDTVLRLGDLGCFDEHGVFPLNIVKDGDRILGYIGGWSRRVSVSVETSIGLAVSDDDGLTFERIGRGPVLTSSLREPCLVGDPFVAIYGNVYYMWYIYGIKWIAHSTEVDPQRIYKIGYATSNDGMAWSKADRQIISDKLGCDECQALPSVISIGNKFHMFFCYRQAIDFRKNRDNAYRIGYAFSNDLKSWIRADDQVGIDVSDDGWDSEMQCYPHVFECDGKIFMLYNGNEFGRFGFGIAVLEN